MPVKGFADQSVNDRFHLTRNHIAANEILTVEDCPTFSRSVSRCCTSISSTAALLRLGFSDSRHKEKKLVNALLKCCVRGVGVLNDMHQATGQVGPHAA